MTAATDRDRRAAVPAPRKPRGKAQPTLQDKLNNSQNFAALAGALAGGRASIEGQWAYPGTMPVLVEPKDAEDSWRVLDLDEDALRHIAPSRIGELLIDLSPDVNRANNTFLTLANPAWEVAAYRVGTRDVHPEAMALIEEFFGRLERNHGSVDVVINRLFMAAWLRGAFFSELVLDKAGRVAVDLATPDPITVRFARMIDPERGEFWALGQRGGPTGFIPLHDRPTVIYIPINPLPGSPYGRAQITPALFTGLFVIGILHDTRRVIAQQGYPRIDISIDFDALLASLPPDAEDDPEKLLEWVNAHKDQVIDAYKKLQPDDAYVHASTISVNRPVGVDATALGGISALLGILTKGMTKALGTMPLLSGEAEGVSEASANRQSEVYLMGIGQPQNLCGTMLETHLSTMLRARGVQATIEFQFDENRETEKLRDQQVLQMTIANAEAMYRLGYVDQDEAAQLVVGHNAVLAEPIMLTGGGVGDAANALSTGSVKPDDGGSSAAQQPDNKKPQA